MKRALTIDQAFSRLMLEVHNGQTKHGRIASWHEGWARLTGEFVELAEAVLMMRGDERAACVRLEALQVAAVALRMAVEVEGEA